MGSRVLVDPSLGRSNQTLEIDTLALLVDTVLVVDPTAENLADWHYEADRFEELVKAGAFLPIFTKRSMDSDGLKHLSRYDILEDSRFFATYEEMIEEDRNDPLFRRICVERSQDEDDLAFYLNWDLIMAQVLGAAVLTGSEHTAILEYKLGKLRGFTSKPSIIPEAQDSQLIRNFFHRAISRIPMDLSIDELNEFRREKSARRFREWLGVQFHEKMKGNLGSMSVDEALFLEFQELINLVQSRTGKVSGLVTGITAGVMGLIGGPMVMVPALAVPFVFPRVLNEIWKRVGPNNWVILMIEMKEKGKSHSAT